MGQESNRTLPAWFYRFSFLQTGPLKRRRRQAAVDHVTDRQHRMAPEHAGPAQRIATLTRSRMLAL